LWSGAQPNVFFADVNEHEKANRNSKLETNMTKLNKKYAFETQQQVHEQYLFIKQLLLFLKMPKKRLDVLL
jgi:hypothetical protein